MQRAVSTAQLPYNRNHGLTADVCKLLNSEARHYLERSYDSLLETAEEVALGNLHPEKNASAEC